MASPWIALVSVLALVAAPSSPRAGSAKVAYTLTDEPGTDGSPGCWRVALELSGLRPEDGAVGLVSNGWGWPQDRPYLELVECEPPLAKLVEDGSALTLELPPRWNGRARVVYRLRLTQRGTDEHARSPLASRATRTCSSRRWAGSWSRCRPRPRVPHSEPRQMSDAPSG
jgi:hypothetical protein